MADIIATPEYTGETKKCKCCGKELPITHFQRYAGGYRKICNECRRRESGATDKFKDFTSRELIDELKARGYEGEIHKKIIETIKL